MNRRGCQAGSPHNRDVHIKKKQLLWGEWLRDEVLAEVAHRHIVLTIPRLLRSLFRRRRELLTDLARSGAEAVQELVRLTCGSEARLGIVVSVATAGDLLQWHPHLHLITTDAGRTKDGCWCELLEWDGQRLMRLFGERLLATLVERKVVSKELVAKLLAWRHPGFSAHVGDRIAPQDKRCLEDTAAYLVRNPLSLKKLVVRRARVNRARLVGRDRFAIPGLDGQQAVLYRSKMNPFLGWRITVRPDVCAGKPCIRDLRFPVSRLLGVARGATDARSDPESPSLP